MAASAQDRTAPWTPSADLVTRHDSSVDNYLKLQLTDPQHPRRGGWPDADGLFHSGPGSGSLDAYMAAYVCPQSRHYRSNLLVERMRLSAGYLERMQTPDGNIDLPITNFNSPPDTAFTIHGAGGAALLAKQFGHPELLAILEPFLRKAASGLVKGGIHTPNHRWVVCEALAILNDIFPDPAFLRRIDQWLAEGIDIDADGQYTERSTIVYNAVTNRALSALAIRLNRPQLLDPVRRNLESMLYLLHPGGEVVTEISRRQDLFERGDMSRYWFPLRYTAIQMADGRLATLVNTIEAKAASLSLYLQYPQLQRALPEPAPLPEDFQIFMPVLGVGRIRRGDVSATAVLNSSRCLSLRKGAAVVEAIRFASAFFGKGQFVPNQGGPSGRGFALRQSLHGPYYQPLDPVKRVGTEDWEKLRAERKQTEVCRMEYEVFVRERERSFAIDIAAHGTGGVPLTVEVGLRTGGQLEGCTAHPSIPNAHLLTQGMATYRVGGDAIRFGPGFGEHRYTQVRGAEPKLPMTSVYLCGYTPFAKTIEFSW